MLKKTITYEDYFGVARTEDFYFNLTEAELFEMELATAGGYTDTMMNIIRSKDSAGVITALKNLILKAYGEKSPDGKRFIKTAELSTEFSQTEAYSQLYMSLGTDAKAAAEFAKGIIPAKLAEKIPDDAKLPGITNIAPIN